MKYELELMHIDGSHGMMEATEVNPAFVPQIGDAVYLGSGHVLIEQRVVTMVSPDHWHICCFYRECKPIEEGGP